VAVGDGGWGMWSEGSLGNTVVEHMPTTTWRTIQNHPCQTVTYCGLRDVAEPASGGDTCTIDDWQGSGEITSI